MHYSCKECNIKNFSKMDFYLIYLKHHRVKVILGALVIASAGHENMWLSFVCLVYTPYKDEMKLYCWLIQNLASFIVCSFSES